MGILDRLFRRTTRIDTQPRRQEAPQNPAAASVQRVAMNMSLWGSFVEKDLEPWAKGHHGTADGIREDLASTLGIEGETIRVILDELVIPVACSHAMWADRFRSDPVLAKCGVARRDVLSPCADLAAWLVTAVEPLASTRLRSSPAALVLYFGLTTRRTDLDTMREGTDTLLFTALAQGLNRRNQGHTFDGRCFRAYEPSDIVRVILKDSSPELLFREVREYLIGNDKSSERFEILLKCTTS